MYFNQNLGDHKAFAAAHPALEQAAVQISTIRSCTDKRPKPVTFPLREFIGKLHRHEARESKDGAAFIPAVFKEGATRASANVEAITALVLDIDDGTPYSVMLPKLAPFAHVFHTSHSHTPELHKYRIVIFLAEPIPAADWNEFWLRAAQHFGHMDPATKDPARLYYLPAHPPGAQECLANFNAGKLLHPDDLPPLQAEAKARIALRATASASGVGIALDSGRLAELGIEGSDDLKPHAGLPAVVQRCVFMQHASDPAHQGKLSEPVWMAMMTNACGFEKSDAWIHAASEHHDGYDESDTQKRIERYRQNAHPVTCERIRELGFTACPSGGCKTPKGEVVKAPAGLWGWAFQRMTPQVAPERCVTDLKAYEVGNFNVSDAGITHTVSKKDGPEVTQVSLTRIDVTALGRTHDSGNWGLMLSMLDHDKVRKTWMMPMEMLGSPRQAYRETLLAMGAALCPDKRASQLLAQYLLEARPEQRVMTVDRLGWHADNFVLPDTFYGPAKDQQVVLQGADSATALIFDQSGTLEGWQHNVAAQAVGNSRLILALSTALTGCVLPLLGEENLGFNLRGASSIGKSLSLKVAASVWGGKGFVRTWNATGNGLQSVASLHNHTFLPLDEMGEAQVSTIGSVVFALGNGVGRIRADQHGEHRSAKRWQLSYLSTSERSLASIMAEAGQQVLAGQEVRLVEIPADAGKGFGIFDTLNGAESGVVLAKSLQEAISQHYGHAGRAWVQLLADPDRQADILARIRAFAGAFIDHVASTGDAGQVGRVASRFALVAAVGEVCSAEGVLPWPANTAMAAMRRCLADWIDQRGGRGELEQEQAIATVREFIMRHGNSRFEEKSVRGVESASDALRRLVINRAGFIERNTVGERVFYISADVYKSEVCGSMDVKLVTKYLAAQGFLVTGGSGNQHRLRNGDGDRCYYYAVNERILGDAGTPENVASAEPVSVSVSPLARCYSV